MKSLLLIINPHSGRADIRHRLMEVIELFSVQGYTVTCVPTRFATHATEIVRDLGASFDRIVCCGGDGTVNEVLCGLMSLEQRPPLGILPCGTINDYAHSLAIPSATISAAEVAAGDLLFPIDVGSLNGRYFNYIAAFGIFTDVPYETDQDAKKALGALAYVLEGLRRVNTIRPYHIRLRHDDGEVEGEYIAGLFSNTISIGGVRSAYRGAQLDDGLLEIGLIKPPASLTDVQEFVNILLSLKSAPEVDSEFLTVIHTRRAQITAREPLAFTVDGENGGLFASADIKTHQKAITVVVGEEMGAK